MLGVSRSRPNLSLTRMCTVFSPRLLALTDSILFRASNYYIILSNFFKIRPSFFSGENKAEKKNKERVVDMHSNFVFF